MLKKLSMALVVACMLSGVAMAESSALGPDSSSNSTNAATLDTLQPANRSLQSTGSVPASDDTSGTGASTLQPAGNKQATLEFIGSDFNGPPIAGSTTGDANSMESRLILGVSALGFLITAYIIFQTSQRLEAANSKPSPAGISIDTPAPPLDDGAPEVNKP